MAGDDCGKASPFFRLPSLPPSSYKPKLATTGLWKSAIDCIIISITNPHSHLPLFSGPVLSEVSRQTLQEAPQDFNRTLIVVDGDGGLTSLSMHLECCQLFFNRRLQER